MAAVSSSVLGLGSSRRMLKERTNSIDQSFDLGARRGVKAAQHYGHSCENQGILGHRLTFGLPCSLQCPLQESHEILLSNLGAIYPAARTSLHRRAVTFRAERRSS